MSKSALQQVLEEAGYACQSYSGRDMMGKKCLAVRLTDGVRVRKLFADVLECAFDLVEYALQPIVRAFRMMESDNLGHDTIIYFPNTKYSDDEPKEEDSQ